MSEEVQEITYIPLSEEFGAEEMFAQGAAALDLAAIFALERKDFDGLIRVAREWTRMGAAISGIDIPEEGKKVLKFGFNKESVEEENDGEANSKSDGKDDLQSKGRLYSYRIRGHRSSS
jgi:hypothetical protein